MGQHLLLIDDNSSLLKFTSLILGVEFPEAEIRIAETCDEARGLTRGWEPGVLLVDRSLPDGDGLEFLSELKAEYPSLEGMLITGRSVDATTPTQDVRAVIFKPFDADDLIAQVRSALVARYRPLVTPNPPPQGYVSRHEIRNLLSSLMVGVRAFQGDVIDNAANADALPEIAKRYGDRLVCLVSEISASIDNAGLFTRDEN